MSKNREGFPVEKENNNIEDENILEEGGESKEKEEFTENRVIEIIKKIRKIDFEKNDLEGEFSMYQNAKIEKKSSNKENLMICEGFLSKAKKILELLKDKDVIRFCGSESINKDKDYLESFFVKGMEEKIKSLSD